MDKCTNSPTCQEIKVLLCQADALRDAECVIENEIAWRVTHSMGDAA